MESRNIELTLEKAREWYNSGSADLKEVALQAYTEEELTTPEWKNIKTFEDACRVLRIYDRTVHLYLGGSTDTAYYHHMDAVNKLDIIRKALNGDWKPSIVEGHIYYPHIRIYPAGQKAKEIERILGWKLSKSFIANGKKYTIVGSTRLIGLNGLTNWGLGYGEILPNLGLLGCKSKEIVEHMLCYFSKEIFEAIYAHHAGTYQWV